MKIFISTVGILLLSFFLSETKTSSQDIIIEDYTIHTYSESEMLLRYLTSRVKLAHCEVLLISLKQDIDNANLYNPGIQTESFEKMLYTLDSLDNEITPPTNKRN